MKNHNINFDKDVIDTGSYLYTKNKLSSITANINISKEMKKKFSYQGKNILDFGCGDGVYTQELSKFNPKTVHGVDISKEGIKTAKKKYKNINFNVGGYSYLKKCVKNKFDLIIFRGVLHHVKNPRKYILEAARISKVILILEPNGHNPIVKFLEKYSKYHIDHGERSFTSNKLFMWCKNSKFSSIDLSFINIIPFFCPDWMVYMLNFFYPIIKNIPFVKKYVCGQILIVASR